jgi:predicted PurR-regulated permease PerM
MKREYFLVTLFFFIAAVFIYLFYRIIIPFFVPITWAAVFVILLHPLYEKLRRRIHSPGLTSLLMCLFVIVVIIGPIAYLFAALVNEAAGAVAKVNAMYRAGEFDDILRVNLPWIDAIKAKLSQYYDLSKINIDELIKDAIDTVTGIIFNQTSWLIANGTRTVFYFVLMVFTMFYFFRDGERIVGKAKRLMPISPEQVDRVFIKLRDVIYATMYGGVVVALIQGLLGGILFAVMGVSSAVFWGAVMAFLSIIPILGAFMVYVPAGILLILGGSYFKGILVIAIGTVVISQSDNLIRPYLIAGRTEMHPLLLFFSIMGGISMFGLLGVVVGPLVAAVFVTLLKLFEMRLHPSEEATIPDEDLPPQDPDDREAESEARPNEA